MSYIPAKDADFLDWSRNILTQTAAHADGWNIPAGAVTLLQSAFDAYQAAYIKAQDPNRGKVHTLKKNEARDALKAAMRSFLNERLRYNSAVTDDDRRSLGITIPDGIRTPQPAPATHPEFEIDTSELRQLTVRFRNNGSERLGKPKKAHGAEIRWDYRNAPPEDIDSLPHSEFATRSPHTLVFKEGERGKMVYICLRWENGKGEKGPWGEIIGAVVP